MKYLVIDKHGVQVGLGDTVAYESSRYGRMTGMVFEMRLVTCYPPGKDPNRLWLKDYHNPYKVAKIAVDVPRVLDGKGFTIKGGYTAVLSNFANIEKIA